MTCQPPVSAAASQHVSHMKLCLTGLAAIVTFCDFCSIRNSAGQAAFGMPIGRAAAVHTVAVLQNAAQAQARRANDMKQATQQADAAEANASAARQVGKACAAVLMQHAGLESSKLQTCWWTACARAGLVADMLSTASTLGTQHGYAHAVSSRERQHSCPIQAVSNLIWLHVMGQRGAAAGVILPVVHACRVSRRLRPSKPKQGSGSQRQGRPITTPWALCGMSMPAFRTSSASMVSRRLT